MALSVNSENDFIQMIRTVKTFSRPFFFYIFDHKEIRHHINARPTRELQPEHRFKPQFLDDSHHLFLLLLHNRSKGCMHSTN